MSALSSAIEKISPQIAAELGAMNTAERRRTIRKMCSDDCPRGEE